MSDFAKQVYAYTSQIPKGRVSTYKLIAQALGKPNSSRAVGQVLKKNSTPIIVPCHRVISSNGSVHGYLGSVDATSLDVKTKVDLLLSEGVPLINHKLSKSQMKIYIFDQFLPLKDIVFHPED